MTAWRRYLIPILLTALALLAWWPALDSTATSRVDEAVKRAVATYAVARSLNAVISVAQETTVSVGVGVGATFAPGQALDPVNDLIEQFSSLMLLAAASLGVQRVLIAIGGQPVFAVAVSLALLAAAIAIGRGARLAPWAVRVLLALLLVRFAVPVMVLASDAGFRSFLQDDYTRGEQGIQLVGEQASRSAAEAPSAAAPPAASPWERLRNKVEALIKGARGAADLAQPIRELAQAAEQLVDHVIRLVAVFVMQTVLLPLLTLWLLLTAGRALAGSLGGEPSRLRDR
jgi:hypothetical protein